MICVHCHKPLRDEIESLCRENAALREALRASHDAWKTVQYTKEEVSPSFRGNAANEANKIRTLLTGANPPIPRGQNENE